MKGYPHTIKQLVNLYTYLEMNPNPPTTEDDQVVETTDILMRTIQARPSRYKDHDIVARQMTFHYKLQQLMPDRATASKVGVKENTTRYRWNNYQKDPDNFILKKGTNCENSIKAVLQDEHKEHLINFFDEKNQATIQDAVEELVNKLSVSR